MKRIPDKATHITEFHRVLHTHSEALDEVVSRLSAAEYEYASIKLGVDSINQELEVIETQISLADSDMQSLQDALSKLKTRLGTHNVRALGAVRTFLFIRYDFWIGEGAAAFQERRVYQAQGHRR